MIDTLKYPDDIEDDNYNTRRVVFMAIPGELDDVAMNWYKGEKSEKIAKMQIDKDTMPEVRCMITLPLPGSLSDSQQHSWDTESALGSATNILGSIKDYVLRKAGKSFNADKLNKIVETVGDANSYLHHVLGIRKRVPNPGQYQTYKNSSLRSFDFNFSFIPETKNEAKNIIDIITAFKVYSSPSKDIGGVTMLSPFMWLITITNGVVNKLLSLKVCVCNKVDVVYGTDKFDVFEDGMPKKIELKLGFNETELLFAENYNTGLETKANSVTSVLSNANGFTNSRVTASSDNILDASGGDLIESGSNLAESAGNKITEKYNAITGAISGLIG